MQMKTLPRTFSTFQFNVRFRLVFSTKTRRQWKRLVHFTYPLTAAVAGAPKTTSQPVTFNSLFSIDLWDMANIRSVHSLMLPSHLFFCPPCLLPPFTVSCKMVLVRPDERENMTITLQFASLYDRQEVFVWSDCLLDLGADFLVGNMVFV